MPLTKEEKEEIVAQFGLHEGDTGSSSVQVAMLTKRILHLTEHLDMHKKDNHTRRGLVNMVGQRRRHLRYLQNNNPEVYRDMLERLGLRR